MLDPNTIGLEHAILQAFSTVMTLANWRINRGLSGMHWFFLYNLILLAGTILGGLRDEVSPLYSVVLSNLLFATGYFLLFIAVTFLFERGKGQFSVQFALVLTCAITMLEYGFLAPNLRKRIVAFSLVVGLQQLHSAFLLRPRHRSAFADSGAPLAGMLVLLAVNNVLRILVALSRPGSVIAQSSSSIYLFLEILNTCLQCGTIVAYVWITASMLRRDLEVQATTDPLTGLLNRRAFERLALQHLQQLRVLEGSAALLTLDLDGFKQVNDARGHVCGDEVLVQVSGRLRASLGPHDLAARLGGDEFAVFLLHATRQHAAAFAGDICHTISTVALSGDKCAAGISASIGLTCLEAPLPDWESMLTGCDDALYEAKRAGGNRVVAASQVLCDAPPFPSPSSAKVRPSAFDFPSTLPYN